MFCAPELIFGGTECVVSRFHVLRARTSFMSYRGCRLLFSSFACPESYSTLPRDSCPIFVFCAPRLVFGGPEGVGSRFHVLRARTYFRRYRGRPVPFACFARSDSFSAVLRVSGPVFMFCAPKLIIGGTKGFRCRFLVLRSRTHFRRYRERRVPFSCFALLDSFSAIPRASGPVFKFCARNHFRRYQRRRVPFSSFARPDMFSAVPRALTEGVSSRFQVLRARTLFGGKEGVGPYFHVLGAGTHFL
jgi:hypothetical protein